MGSVVKRIGNSGVKALSSANYTILDNDGYHTVNVTTGASVRTVTLPVAANNVGRKIVIKKVDSGAGFINVACSNSETIDGALTNTLHKIGSYIEVYCDGIGYAVCSVSDWLYLAYVGTSITTSSASQAGIAVSGGVWRLVGVVTTVGGNGTTKAFDVSITTTAGSQGVNGESRVFLPLNSSYGGGVIEIPPVRVTADTSHYLNASTLDSGTATGCYGYIKAERIG